MNPEKALHKAQILLRRRQFSQVIKILEPLVPEFRDNVNSFTFFYTLGVACLYVGDNGGANTYLGRARKFRLQDPNLQLAQAALFTNRLEISHALEYYLDILDSYPNNSQAKKNLSLIRRYGTPEVLTKWISNGKIKRFYPKLGPNPIWFLTSGIVVFVLCILVGTAILLKGLNSYDGFRGDLSAYELTYSEKKEATIDKGVFFYELEDKDALEIYEKIQKSFQVYDDNSAQIACNIILNSNASGALKHKARMMEEYLWKPQPTFDSLKFNLSYEQVSKEPFRHVGCHVIWTGRIGNIKENADSIEGSLLVGYDKLTNVSGLMKVIFPSGSTIDPQKPVKILGILSMEEKQLILNAIALYQPINQEF